MTGSIEAIRVYEVVAHAAASWPSIQPGTVIDQAIRHRFGQIKSKSWRIAAHFSATAIEVKTAVTDYLPAFGPGHALVDGVPIYVRLQEPQASKGIAYYCAIDDPAGVSAQRCVAAVRALLPNEPGDSAYISSLRDGESSGFEVADEVYVVGDNKRMDWVIGWQNGGRRFRLVVEMKYEHTTTAAQLNRYGKDTKAHVGAQSNYRLVFLTEAGYFPWTNQRLNYDWHPVSWLNFLRRWEQFLPTCADDIEFRMFRRQLWARIGI